MAGLDDLEVATCGRVAWFNEDRLHGELHDHTSAEIEAAYQRTILGRELREISHSYGPTLEPNRRTTLSSPQSAAIVPHGTMHPAIPVGRPDSGKPSERASIKPRPIHRAGGGE